MNLNVVVVKYAATDAVTQVAVAAVSLCLLTSIAMLLTVGMWKQPNVTIPGVISWASGGIAAELFEPMDKVQDLFGDVVIKGTRGATQALCAIVAVFATIFFIVRMFNIFRGRSKQKGGEEEKGRSGLKKTSS